MVVAVAGESAMAADWPGFLGPTADGVAPDTHFNKDWTARPPKTLWTVAMSDDGHSGPSVADGKVFIVDHRDGKDLVRALDFATGADIWSCAYVDSDHNQYGFTVSTPLVAGGRVYVTSRLCKVVCLDEASGALIWSRDVRKDFACRNNEWGWTSSPLLVDGKVIVVAGGQNAALVALDAATGQTVWQGAGDSIPGYATPRLVTLNGQQQILAFLGQELIGVEPATGKRLWNLPWTLPHNQNSAMPIVRGNTIFITSPWGKGSAMIDVTANQPRILWETKEMQARFASPVRYENRIYGTYNDSRLVCMDSVTGKVIWQQSGFEFASTILADGCVFVLEGKSGDLILLDATTPQYKELSRIRPLGGPEAWNPPIIADGRLLIRSRQTLLCLDLRQAAAPPSSMPSR
jgi:outer membrane protein assembly factor BamB